MPRPRLLLLASAGSLFLPAAAASGATVDYDPVDDALVFAGDATAEALTLTSPGAGVVVRFTLFSGSLTTTAPGCVANGPLVVDCSTTPSFVILDLGDGADFGSVDASMPETMPVIMSGGGGSDGLTGGPADDAFLMGPSAAADGPGDTVNGGGGRDLVSYGDRLEPVTVELERVEPQDGAWGEGDDIRSDVEDIVGGAGADLLAGSGQANVILGGAGSDQIDGLGGADDLIGEEGDDFFSMRGATPAEDGIGDRIVGGPGFDVVWYSRGTPVSLSLDGVANDGGAGEEDDIASDVEGLIGGFGPDLLTGNDASNLLNGGMGTDVLRGGDGDDILDMGFSGATTGDRGDIVEGGPGVDEAFYGSRVAPVTVTLDGAANDGETGEDDDVRPDVEIVTGGASHDRLTGSAAAETLDGGGGSDVIDGGQGPDVLLGSADNDTITSRDGTADSVDCGDGIDRNVADTAEASTAGCESIERPVMPPSPPLSTSQPVFLAPPRSRPPQRVLAPGFVRSLIGRPRITPTGVLLVPFTCPADAPRCYMSVTVRRPRGKTARRLFVASRTIRPGRRTQPFRLSSSRLRTARRDGRAIVEATLTVGYPSPVANARALRRTVVPVPGR